MSKLVRTLAGYAACRADAIASGSKAQVMYFIDDAKADIASLAAENKRLRAAIKPIVKAAGMLPMTYGPDHDPIEDDEEVTIRCDGFSLGEMKAGDLKFVYDLWTEITAMAETALKEG